MTDILLGNFDARQILLMDNRRQALLRSVLGIAYRPWFAALTAVFGAFAGFMAAIYADEIRGAFPFPFPWHTLRWNGPVVWAAVITWIALAAFGLMFGLNSWALTKSTDLQLGELKTNTLRLQDLIQTLPPESYKAAFELFVPLTAPHTLILSRLLEDSSRSVYIASVEG